MKKVLNVYGSLASSYSLGWLRDDLPMVHVFAQAAPGEQILPSNGHGGPHWPCPVCADHDYTATTFWAQIEDALERGPSNHVDSGGHPLIAGEKT